MKSKRKRAFQQLRQELDENDYKHKLSNSDRDWLYKFYFEYYQGEFSDEGALHAQESQKECKQRHYINRRQLHNVGGDVLEKAIDQAYKAQGNPGAAHRYYLREDYATFHEKEDNEHDILEKLDKLV